MIKVQITNYIGNIQWNGIQTCNVSMTVVQGSSASTIMHPALENNYYLLTEQEYDDLLKKINVTKDVKSPKNKDDFEFIEI